MLNRTISMGSAGQPLPRTSHPLLFCVSLSHLATRFCENVCSGKEAISSVLMKDKPWIFFTKKFTYSCTLFAPNKELQRCWEMFPHLLCSLQMLAVQEDGISIAQRCELVKIVCITVPAWYRIGESSGLAIFDQFFFKHINVMTPYHQPTAEMQRHTQTLKNGNNV